MGPAKMWAAAAAESCKTASPTFRMVQMRSSSPLGPHSCPTSPVATPKSLYIKAQDLEARAGSSTAWNRRCGPTVTQVVMLFVGITMLIVLQSVRNDKAACSVPWANPWGSVQGRTVLNSRNQSAEMGKVEDLTPNDKAWILKQAEENGTTTCDQVRTTYALVLGLEPSSKGNIRLETDQYHQILIVSYAEDGSRRCRGGDFYEADLSGMNWKSRPPIKDLGDGSYRLSLRMDGRMAGLYTFKLVLLFSNLHGLDLWPEEFAQDREVVRVQIEFIDPLTYYSPTTRQTELQRCTQEDFKLAFWQGRWTRAHANESCVVDLDARYRCLDPAVECERPWCEGPLGSLESNGWVYSAHCAFHIFTKEEAWSCLNGRHLFFWGDSNHQDTIRNLLNFILGFHSGNLDRTFQTKFSNPINSSEVLVITSIFNGHYEMGDNNLGLGSLYNFEYSELIKSFFLPYSMVGVPDAVILNSGLHDGKAWPNLTAFAGAAVNASTFWEALWRNVNDDESLRPTVLFRTTVAPAGVSRIMPANPHKMESFNTILREELVSKFGQDSLKIVDAYDMTFPWHFDNLCSDGGHYGRTPTFNDGIAHQYFVDVMLAHVLLNAICPV